MLPKINYPLVLDGGLSNELEKSGCDLQHKLWSAKLIDKEVEKIVEVHRAYLNSGAECIITSSYQATEAGFTNAGYSQPQAEQLILKTVWAAEEAVKLSNKKRQDVLIAASIGPYGAFLANGSEYTGDYMIDNAELKLFHEQRINVLDNSSADFFACETIPSKQEAIVLNEILLNTKKSAWISFSCKDEAHICDGSDLAEVAKLFTANNNVFAIGINCTAPAYITPLIKKLKEVCGDKKIVVYPNSGEVYDAGTKKWSAFDNSVSSQFLIRQWHEAGADIIGGCCRTGPEQTKIISTILQ